MPFQGWRLRLNRKEAYSVARNFVRAEGRGLKGWRYTGFAGFVYAACLHNLGKLVMVILVQSGWALISRQIRACRMMKSSSKCGTSPVVSFVVLMLATGDRCLKDARRRSRLCAMSGYKMLRRSVSDIRHLGVRKASRVSGQIPHRLLER